MKKGQEKKTFSDFKTKKELQLIENKSMVINDIYGIDIEYFRLFKNKTFDLGKRITVVAGRNGTMKSTVMGLIAQPFRTEFKDVHGKTMQTKFSDVFKLSTEKDADNYLYHIKLNIDNNLLLREKIPLYFQKGNAESKYSQKDRHRLVPSGRGKGDGYFTLPSVYINLKRLYPLIDSGDISTTKIEYNKQEKKFVSQFYEKILLKTDFNEFEKYNTDISRLNKIPFGPCNSYYDISSISSGEDNLSTFIDTMISFMRVFEENKKKGKNILTGIFSIDEFEASLHPIAQLNLFNFLLSWSQQYNVKVVINTHSLYLIQSIYLAHKKLLDTEEIVLNFISSYFESEDKLNIYKNPEYSLAYQELTLSNYEENNPLLKVKILCEDSTAVKLLKKIIKKRVILNELEFNHIVSDTKEGISYTSLSLLCRSFPKILEETKSIVIFDADVDTSSLKLGNYKHFLKIPSLHSFPIEKELVYYILNLDGSDAFFKKFNKTKEAFKQEFSTFNIPLKQNDHETVKIQTYKNWYNKNVKEVNTYLTYYVNNNTELWEDFIKNLLSMINNIRKNFGFSELKN